MNKEFMRIWVLVVAVMVGVMAGWLFGRNGCEGVEVVTRDTVRVTDTMMVRDTVWREERRVDTVTRWLRVARTDTMRVTDTVVVEVPIVQRIYEGAGYRAWVSGYDPKLDSLEMERETERIIEKRPARRWGIGVGVGAGWNGRGRMEPYIGVNLSYRLWDL